MEALHESNIFGEALRSKAKDMATWDTDSGIAASLDIFRGDVVVGRELTMLAALYPVKSLE